MMRPIAPSRAEMPGRKCPDGNAEGRHPPQRMPPFGLLAYWLYGP